MGNHKPGTNALLPGPQYLVQRYPVPGAPILGAVPTCLWCRGSVQRSTQISKMRSSTQIFTLRYNQAPSAAVYAVFTKCVNVRKYLCWFITHGLTNFFALARLPYFSGCRLPFLLFIFLEFVYKILKFGIKTIFLLICNSNYWELQHIGSVP